MARKPGVPKKRLHFALTEDTEQGLEELKATMKAESLSEVVRRALRVTKVVYEAVANGDEIYIHHRGDEDKRTRVLVA